MSKFISPRRIATLGAASAMIASMAVSAMPAATLAAAPTSGPTGFFREGRELTAKQIGGVVTGEVNADGFDIGVYNPTSVTNANVHGAQFFGVVVNGKTVNTTGSKIHDIGDNPFDGMQRGRAILYINGAHGTIAGNTVYDFNKNGIEISGLDADGGAPSASTTSATVTKNVVTGEGHIDYIAQNGIVIRNGANALVTNNSVSKLFDTDTEWEAMGLLNYDAGKVTVSGNQFADTEVRIDGIVTANVTGYTRTTVRPHSVRVDLISGGRPAPQAVLGTKLDWKIKIDGRTTFHIKQDFGAHSVYSRTFATGSGRHVVKVFKNDVLVRTAIVR